ncbi:hypothetical protein IANJMKHF_00351 [Klebsiella phage CPRSA]|nr:hypothetical protein IANJMKHF_00351 [Klebsiella phage CPRSA]
MKFTTVLKRVITVKRTALTTSTANVLTMIL